MSKTDYFSFSNIVYILFRTNIQMYVCTLITFQYPKYEFMEIY